METYLCLVVNDTALMWWRISMGRGPK